MCIRDRSYTDLTPGDLVVHEHHGIGRFIGMERMTVDLSLIHISVCNLIAERGQLMLELMHREQALAAAAGVVVVGHAARPRCV